VPAVFDPDTVVDADVTTDPAFGLVIVGVTSSGSPGETLPGDRVGFGSGAACATAVPDPISHNNATAEHRARRVMRGTEARPVGDRVADDAPSLRTASRFAVPRFATSVLSTAPSAFGQAPAPDRDAPLTGLSAVR
jgi:hypothetical protein